MDNKQDIQTLLKKYVGNNCTLQELETLFAYLQQPENDLSLDNYLATEWQRAQKENNTLFIEPDWDAMYISVTGGKKRERPKTLLHTVRANTLIQVIAACLIIGVVIAGAILLINKPTMPSMAARYKNDAKPGGNHATLTLANGTHIMLDDARAGQLAQQSGVSIAKSPSGQIVYNVSAATNNAVGFNTISTPKGGQYQVILADGSKVWLNAESELKYPTRFTGADRVVQLSGEGYFEVAHYPEKPFKVITANQEVRVLGTHFDVNAYTNEPLAKTTLVQGSVSVTALDGNHDHKILAPGQQALLGNGILKAMAVDTTGAIAWKNGYFIFNNEDMASIMRNAERWYDVEVVFEKDDLKNKRFEGTISRFKNVSEMLRKFELTGIVHFKIEGRRITVMQ